MLAKESIIEGRAINLTLLDKNLSLRGHCPIRIFEDLRCNSVAEPTRNSNVFVTTVALMHI